MIDRTHRGRPWFFLLLALLVAPAATARADADDDVVRHPGYVDASPFIKLAGGDEAIRLEVQVFSAALRLMRSLPDPIGPLVRDLKSVRAVILELDSDAKRESSRAMIRDFDQRLRKQGWSRLAVVREQDEEVNVMVREDGEDIVGVAVMIVNQSEGEFIFTNIVGKIDLDALQQFGEQTNIPGLDHLKGAGS